MERASLGIIAFSTIAAIGNAIFALAQRQALGTQNGLLFVALSALGASILCNLAASILNPMSVTALVSGYWQPLLLSASGLFLTYLGFHLRYTRFGTTPYLVYASLSIVTTTVGVGILYLRESLNVYRAAALVCAVVAVILFSMGGARDAHGLGSEMGFRKMPR
jgi:drug/metabolite transporter (DMT)-like permease